MTTINAPLQTTCSAPPRMLNINEASKACGLSPSVLRIWELRYGWPNPKRKANGYRAYSPHLVEDLKRMAKLVKSGIPIRQLVVDGLPRWPVEADSPEAKPRTIDQTRALPKPQRPSEARLQRDLLTAVETHRTGALHELIQRCQWEVRPTEEVGTYLAPLVSGIMELEELERPMPGSGQFLKVIVNRARQLASRFAVSGKVVPVVARTKDDEALAWIVALILRQRGMDAKVQDSVAKTAVLAGKGDETQVPEHRGWVTITETEGADTLGSLLTPQSEVPWLP